jgi:hypothetical protein
VKIKHQKCGVKEAFKRYFWQCGSRMLSAHSCEPSLQMKAMSVHEAMKEEVTTVAEEAGVQYVSEEGVGCPMFATLTY